MSNRKVYRVKLSIDERSELETVGEWTQVGCRNHKILHLHSTLNARLGGTTQKVTE